MLVCLGMIPIRNMTGITAHHHLCTEVMSASTRNLCRPRAFTEVLQLVSLALFIPSVTCVCYTLHKCRPKSITYGNYQK